MTKNGFTVAPRELHTINLARCFAALAVVLFHSLPIVLSSNVVPLGLLEGRANQTLPIATAQDVALLSIFGFGFLGVPLFFVISGFCIHLQYVDRAIQLKSFFMRRFFRLYPLYLALISVLFFIAWMKKDPAASLPNAIGHLFFWHYSGPPGSDGMGISPVLWTLALEFQFYIMYALLLSFLKRNNVIRITILWLALDIAYRVWWHYYVSSSALGGLSNEMPAWLRPNRLALVRFPEWLLGAVLAEQLIRNHNSFKTSYPLLFLACVLLGIAACGSALGMKIYTAFDIAAALAFYMILKYCISRELLSPNLSRSKIQRGLESLGNFSYSIYLMHFSICCFFLAVVQKMKITSDILRAGFWIAEIAIILLASYISYRLLEAPSHRFAKRLGTRRQTQINN